MKRRSALFALVAVCGSLGLVFAVGEASLRWIHSPADFPDDRVLSRRFHPHRQLRYVSEQGEFDVLSVYNSDGMRDRERSREKPPDTRRILVVGDSFTEAKQVELEETYPALLEVALSRETATEVLNAGHSGFGSAEEFLVLKHFGVTRGPDLVIQAFFLNDVYDDLMAADDIEWGEDGLPVRLRGGGSEFVRLISNLSRRLPFLWKTKVVDRDWLGDLRRDPFAGIRANLKEDDEDWVITLRTIEASAQLAAQHGAGYLLVLLPLALQVDADYVDAVSDFYDLDGDSITDAPQRRLEAFCHERGIAVLDLAPALQAHAETDLFFRFDGHWTPAGHEVAAQAIADYLAVEGWPAPTRPSEHAAISRPDELP